MKLKSWKARWKSTQKSAYLFLMPWIVGIVAFSIVPMLISFYYSFTDFNMFKEPGWVAFANYKRMFQQDPRFIQSLKITIRYCLVGVPLQLTFALFLAVILDDLVPCVRVFRAIYYVPSLLGGSVAIALLWRQIFGLEGLLNKMLAFLGFTDLSSTSWLNNPKSAIYTLVVLLVWQFGSCMVIFVSGIKNIPSVLYEAAKIDGAGPAQRFLYVTFPFFFIPYICTLKDLQNLKWDMHLRWHGFLWLFSSSLKPEKIIFKELGLIPSQITLENYKNGWNGLSGINFGVYFKNTIFLVIFCIIGNVITCSMTGYAFARLQFMGKKVLFSILMVSMMLPFHVVLLPRFVMFNALGWNDSHFPLIVPKFLATDGFFCYMMVQFMRGIPKELDDAARVDGCGTIQTYFRIIMPLCKSAVTMTVILTLIWTWNDFFSQLIYIGKPCLLMRKFFRW